MQTEQRTGPGRSSRSIERAILIILLSDSGPRSVEQLVRELADSRAEICDAAHNLRDAGLVIVDGDRLSASRAAKAMDRLGV